MKMGRVLVAGIVGGIVVFAWSACVHLFLMQDKFMKPLPNEALLAPALKAGISESGWYFFPGVNRPPNPAEEEAWRAKMKTGPHGIVLYHAEGEEPMSPKQFATEFGAGLLAAMVGAVVLALCGGTASRGLMVGLGLGLFAWLSIDVSYWNWDGFPDLMLLQGLVEQGGGWMLAGLAMGMVIGKSAKAA